MKLTKKGKPDKRYKTSHTLEAKHYYFWKKYGYLVAVGLLGAIAGVILATSLFDLKNNLPQQEQKIEVKVVEAKKDHSVLM